MTKKELLERIEQLERNMELLKAELESERRTNKYSLPYPYARPKLPPNWWRNVQCETHYPPRFHGEVAYKKSLRSHEYKPR